LILLLPPAKIELRGLKAMCVLIASFYLTTDISKNIHQTLGSTYPWIPAQMFGIYMKTLRSLGKLMSRTLSCFHVGFHAQIFDLCTWKKAFGLF
jgi:hypothetical protein